MLLLSHGRQFFGDTESLNREQSQSVLEHHRHDHMHSVYLCETVLSMVESIPKEADMNKDEILKQLRTLFKDTELEIKLDGPLMYDTGLGELVAAVDPKGGTSGIDILEFILDAEEHYGVEFTDQEIYTFRTVGDIVKAIESKLLGEAA